MFEAIIKPRITEKGALLAEKNAYVFDVRSDVTKSMVREAIKATYKVIPTKIAIAQIPSKKKFVKGKKGVKKGGKKAYVYLKKGDQIQFV